MADLLLVANPKRRRRRNPRRRHHARRANPRHRRHARRNPHRRHRRHNPVMRYHRRRHRNPHRRYHRRHHNPSMRGIIGQVLPTVKAGLVGAGGALALDAAWGYVAPNLPASLNNTYVQFGVKALLAVGIGMVGGKVLRGKGPALAVGAITVAWHDLLKATLQQAMPTVFGAGGSLALSGYGSYLSGSAPIVGTATFPKTYQMRNPGFGNLGAYLSGSSGSNEGAGVYVDDQMGFDPWGDGA